MKNFNDKVAAITGAASGIGRALAINLATQHCHLALSDIDELPIQIEKLLSEKFGFADLAGKNVEVQFTLPFTEQYEVKGQLLHGVNVFATLSQEFNDVEISNSAFFGHPDEKIEHRETLIEEPNLSNWELYHTKNISNYCIDVSTMESLPSRYIRSINLGGNIGKKHRLEITGLKNLASINSFEKVGITFKYSEAKPLKRNDSTKNNNTSFKIAINLTNSKTQ
jgi:hypothetical protein